MTILDILKVSKVVEGEISTILGMHLINEEFTYYSKIYLVVTQ
mgnify:CR=1 FL=1